MQRHFISGVIAAVAGLSAVPQVFASFHLMQIEQVIGGVNGDTSAQAIQLRMRADLQNNVSLARLRVVDATGANPVTVIDFTANVGVGQGGRRVLVVSPNMARYLSPTITPDFTMTNLIPASYLAAGSLTFEDDFGTIYWRLSWGGNAYTGPRTGSITNDSDGNFGAFPTPLPSTTLQALRFTGAFSSPSTNNAADYQITTNAAQFTNNANNSSTVSNATCPTASRGDVNRDSTIDGVDIQSFINCITSGNPGAFNCACADINGNGSFDSADVSAMVTRLLGL